MGDVGDRSSGRPGCRAAAAAGTHGLPADRSSGAARMFLARVLSMRRGVFDLRVHLSADVTTRPLRYSHSISTMTPPIVP